MDSRENITAKYENNAEKFFTGNMTCVGDFETFPVFIFEMFPPKKKNQRNRH